MGNKSSLNSIKISKFILKARRIPSSAQFCRTKWRAVNCSAKEIKGSKLYTLVGCGTLSLKKVTKYLDSKRLTSSPAVTLLAVDILKFTKHFQKKWAGNVRINRAYSILGNDFPYGKPAQTCATMIPSSCRLYPHHPNLLEGKLFCIIWDFQTAHQSSKASSIRPQRFAERYLWSTQSISRRNGLRTPEIINHKEVLN
jgi:hypothetical protein